MKFNFPNCKTCNQSVGTSNYSGQCSKCYFQSGEKPEAPAPKRFKFSKGQWIDIIIATPIIAILLFASICRAYDELILRSLENNLANDVHSAKACEPTYQAMVQLKTDDKIALVGIGDPCPTF